MEQDRSSQLMWSWDAMLDAFRGLGGVAKNIGLVDGQSNCGLRALNRAEPVLLRIPRNLLLRIDDIEFDEGRIDIRADANVPESERRFFRNYETAFSWEAGGQTKAAALITALDGLPPAVRQLLIAEFGLGDLLQGDFVKRVQTRFLQSRAFHWNGRGVIAPVLELAHFGTDGLLCERGTHIQIQGYVRNQVILRNDTDDAYSAFCRLGVALAQPIAFSLRMKVPCESKDILIERNPNAAIMRGHDRAPRSSDDGRTLALSYLTIGHKKSPRLPRGSFRTLMREAGLNDPDETFDKVLGFNSLMFINLLKALEPHEGEMVSLLSKVARHQLEAMYHCIGSRELDPAERPARPASSG
jgi:hypothetical protein